MTARYTAFASLLLVGIVFLVQEIQASGAKKAPRIVFCATAENDLVRVAAQSGLVATRFDSPAAAVWAAPQGAGVLILADGYPKRRTPVDSAVLNTAASKGLRLYIEYPAAVPGMTVGPSRDLKLERIVVASEVFGPMLRPMRIAVANACRLVEMKAPESHLVAAKVAGVDTAVFGLKDTQTSPVLFAHPRGDILVATTKLSHFVTGRYMPQDAWAAIWTMILEWVEPVGDMPELRWIQTARPSYSAAEKLPADAEARALRRTRTSLWDLLSRCELKPPLERFQATMLPE